ncbi:MAG: hypothetical protein QM710_01490 [Flavobacterium sp.]
MKKICYHIAALFLLATTSFAQITKVDRKYGPPAWAPSAPVTVQYYYIPDIEVYYDVPAKQYIYLNNGNWVRATALPAQYNGYDLTRSKPIYLTNYKGNTPYVLFKEHQVKYKVKKWKANGHDNGRRGNGKK